MKTDPKLLGALTVSMLRGAEGSQRKEHYRLCRWLQKEIHPTGMILTNMLIAGCIPLLKKQLKIPVAVTLQGDDIFFESLPEPYRQQSIDAMQALVPSIDFFVAHSEIYGNKMAEILRIPKSKLRIVPLAIDTKDFEGMEFKNHLGPIKIGYFARMAPEKGLHLLVDACVLLAQEHPELEFRLEMAGWMGPQHAEYWDEQQKKLSDAKLDGRWTYHGSVDRAGKIAFLSSIDCLCVPTVYEEPKGLFVLEGLAAGVPYRLPNHGAFPELHARFAMGELFEAQSVPSLASSLLRFASDGRLPLELRRQRGQEARNKMSIEKHAQALLDLMTLDRTT